MAVPLCFRCNLPLFLPPGYVGALCPCRVGAFQPPPPVGAPSPAVPTGATSGGSEGFRDGGRGASQSASVSTGRGPEKGSQGSPKPQGGPIEAAAKVLPDDYKPDRDAQDRAEGWFKTKFFKSKGIGDEWKKIVAACKTFGMPDKVKWRDWLKQQWDENRAVAVSVLITAGEIPGPAAAPDLGDAAFVLAELEANPQRDFTVDDLIARVKRPVGGSFDAKSMQAALDRIVDAGLAYQPLIDRFKAVKGAK